MSILNLIENEIDLDENINFTAIIGKNPSKGARSPILWNYVFEKNNIDCRMYCLDVSENNIEKVIYKLNKNKFFLGGAVAVPYKEKIFNLLSTNTNTETKNIGAINCLYRNKDGLLSATNTDGEAALKSFEEKFGLIKEKKVLILGPGGAGKAVISYFYKSISHSNNLYIGGRSEISKTYCQNLNYNFLHWNDFEEQIYNFDIIVNCTTIGSKFDETSLPISKNGIKKIKQNAIIFDIIYDPSPTYLIKQASKNNIKTINGKRMNLLQASLAFDYCIKKDKNPFNTFDIMHEKFKELN